MSRVTAILDLKTALKDSPDVTDDERMRIVANAWLVRLAFLIASLLAFPLAFFLAGALMMWIDAGPGTAVACGLLGAATSALGPALVRHLGLGLEERYLQRVLKMSTTRKTARLGAFGGGSSMAIPTMEIETKDR